MMRSLIVGTAGHIDHGKSALVRALTGTDPDRLPEEKKRGITIDLGFADLSLDDLRLGFVDVPGHERFIKNMLAGAHGIDLLALIIAADEGVMPQTREHFDICQLLGVTDGVVVITKKDLVEDEMLMLVEEEARDLVSGSFLSRAPIVAVSSRTGEGLDHLRSQLQQVAKRTRPRSSDNIMRLPVDRAFSMKGFGAVVTGTLISGNISDADELELLPEQRQVRVRGIQVHGKSVSNAQAGQRTAVNLGGIDVKSISRGMVLAPSGQLRPTQMLDVELKVLPLASRSVRSRARVRVHVGAAEVLGRVKVLEETGEVPPGESGLVQLRLESPIVALHGDRFIVRSYSPLETLGGGIVLDPFAAKHRSKGLALVRSNLHKLTKPARDTKLAVMVQAAGDRGLRREDILAATGWQPETISTELETVKKSNSVIDAGGILIDPAYFVALRDSVVAELDRHHKREPLSRGMLRETLREKLFSHALPELFGAVISDLEIGERIVSEKETLRLAAHKVDLTDEEQQLQKRIEDIYLKDQLETASIDDVLQRAGLVTKQHTHGRKVLQLLINGGQLVRIQGEMFVHAQVLETFKQKLQEYAQQHEPERLMDVADFKELAKISRKYAIPLLEYFDREHITRRAGDKRLILKPR